MTTKKQKVESAVPSTAVVLAREFQTKSRSLLDKARDFAVTTEAEFQKAGEVLQAIKSYTKEIEAKRDEIVKPMNAALKAVRALFKAPLLALAEAEQALKNAITPYYTQKLKEQARLVEKAAAKQEKTAERLEQKGRTAEAVAVRETAPDVETVVPTAGGVSFRKTFEFTVYDESKIPEKYWIKTLDAAAIRKDIVQADGDISIPGITITETKTTVVRAK